MLRTTPARLGLLALLAVPALGCAPSTGTVTGTVTFDGQSVDRGQVTFRPADGKGPDAGGPITDGHYTVEGVPPGSKVVKVEAVKKVPFARSSEDMARMAAERKAKGDGSGLIDPADVIPENAEGNNAKVDVKAGTQTLDFHLKKPVGAKPR